MARIIDGRIWLGVDDMPLIDAMVAWAARVEARIASDQLQNKSPQPDLASDYGRTA